MENKKKWLDKVNSIAEWSVGIAIVLGPIILVAIAVIVDKLG